MLTSDELEKEGISVEVIDPRTLVPLDKKTILLSVKNTGRVFVVHGACERAGFGAGVSAATLTKETFDYLDAPTDFR